MFGLEILDVVIGLMFVYLMLSLFASALNEYISAVLNLRGKELARGLGRLLEDLDENDAVHKALQGVRQKGDAAAASLTQKFYNHPLIRPLATRRGWLSRVFNKDARLPSYIPARTFAMALLDTLGVRDQDAAVTGAAQPAADGSSTPAPTAAADATARTNLAKVLEVLKRESPQDVIEQIGSLRTVLEDANLPPEVKARLVNAVTGTQTQLQKLHDSVEVWFNNAMDRVSGTYKRNVQAVLLVLGAVIAVAMNADTIQMWRQLAANDELRTAMVLRATNTLPTVDSILDAQPGDTTLTVEEAREQYLAVRGLVDGMDLQLGWTSQEAMRIGLREADATYQGSTTPADWWKNPGFWEKVVGLLFTALAVSLGAPFWFDMLNRVVSIRAAGRAPDEKPRSPQGQAKRAAEETPK